MGQPRYIYPYTLIDDDIKLISYVQVVGSPANPGSCSKGVISVDTLLILNTNDLCKAYKLFKSTNLSTNAALCTNNSDANDTVNANPTNAVNDANATNAVNDANANIAKPSVEDLVGHTFATFLNGLNTFINKDQNDDVVAPTPANVVKAAQIQKPFSVSKVYNSNGFI
jgi:hypothetical protein